MTIITCQPRGIDVISSVIVVAGTEEDSVTVSGEEVGTPVLVLVADLESGAVLGLARVVGAHQLKHQIFKSVAPFLYKEACIVYNLIKNSYLDAQRNENINIIQKFRIRSQKEVLQSQVLSFTQQLWYIFF